MVVRWKPVRVSPAVSAGAQVGRVVSGPNSSKANAGPGACRLTRSIRAGFASRSGSSDSFQVFARWKTILCLSGTAVAVPVRTAPPAAGSWPGRRRFAQTPAGDGLLECFESSGGRRDNEGLVFRVDQAGAATRPPRGQAGKPVALNRWITLRITSSSPSTRRAIAGTVPPLADASTAIARSSDVAEQVLFARSAAAAAPHNRSACSPGLDLPSTQPGRKADHRPGTLTGVSPNRPTFLDRAPGCPDHRRWSRASAREYAFRTDADHADDGGRNGPLQASHEHARKARR